MEALEARGSEGVVLREGRGLWLCGGGVPLYIDGVSMLSSSKNLKGWPNLRDRQLQDHLLLSV